MTVLYVFVGSVRCFNTLLQQNKTDGSIRQIAHLIFQGPKMAPLHATQRLILGKHKKIMSETKKLEPRYVVHVCSAI